MFRAGLLLIFTRTNFV